MKLEKQQANKTKTLNLVLNQIPKVIEHRLTKYSSNNKLFNIVENDQEDALKLNGYNFG